jgi:hypothetical protein
VALWAKYVNITKTKAFDWFNKHHMTTLKIGEMITLRIGFPSKHLKCGELFKVLSSL